MTDIVSAAVRSRMMSDIRGTDTRPEIDVRHGLHAMGFRYRLHVPGLPGKPDIVLAQHRAVILVNGCFWHCHDCHLFRWPDEREQFWRRKITRSRERDMEVRNALGTFGWRVLVIWECALKGRNRLPLKKVLKETAAWIRKGGACHEIRGVPDACS
jgi:DNA mismatch endonuclease (patch repair protein)